MHITDEKLIELLREFGTIADEDIDSAHEESKRTGVSLIDVLIGRGDMTESDMLEALGPYFGVPKVDLRKVVIPPEATELVDEGYAKSHNIFVFGYDKEKSVIKVAMIDPLDYDTIAFLRAKFHVFVEAYLTSGSSLKYALKSYQRKIGQHFDDVIEENVEKSLDVADKDKDLSKTASAVPIITILDSILSNAVALGASDVHFEPLENEMLIRYRIDGIMHEILSLQKVIEPILVARVKILAKLQIDEHRTPQDGRFHFEGDETVVDLRVNIMPVFHGEKVEMRILRNQARPLSLMDLGMSEEGRRIIEDEIKEPHGIILVTGPTGHGKTTTLYAVLNILNVPEVNITTIEDPIEYEIERVNQTQVNVKAGITFANGLRALLRQNPDIILIGEIRDEETVEIAIQASLTGHLVLSSLHTNDAPSALPRLIDMGAQSFLLASTINLVIAQRLVRKICVHCIQSYKISDETKQKIRDQLLLIESSERDALKVPDTLYRGKGCPVCGNSGYAGQFGIFEIMPVDREIKELLMQKVVSAGMVRAIAIKNGMRTMFEDGLAKVERGLTTIEEIVRVVRE